MTYGLRLKFSYLLKKSENIALVYIYIGKSVDSVPDLIDVIACHLAEFADGPGLHMPYSKPTKPVGRVCVRLPLKPVG